MLCRAAHCPRWRCNAMDRFALPCPCRVALGRGALSRRDALGCFAELSRRPAPHIMAIALLWSASRLRCQCQAAQIRDKQGRCLALGRVAMSSHTAAASRSAEQGRCQALIGRSMPPQWFAVLSNASAWQRVAGEIRAVQRPCYSPARRASSTALRGTRARRISRASTPVRSV